MPNLLNRCGECCANCLRFGSGGPSARSQPLLGDRPPSEVEVSRTPSRKGEEDGVRDPLMPPQQAHMPSNGGAATMFALGSGRSDAEQQRLYEEHQRLLFQQQQAQFAMQRQMQMSYSYPQEVSRQMPQQNPEKNGGLPDARASLPAPQSGAPSFSAPANVKQNQQLSAADPYAAQYMATYTSPQLEQNPAQGPPRAMPQPGAGEYHPPRMFGASRPLSRPSAGVQRSGAPNIPKREVVPVRAATAASSEGGPTRELSSTRQQVRPLIARPSADEARRGEEEARSPRSGAGASFKPSASGVALQTEEAGGEVKDKKKKKKTKKETKESVKSRDGRDDRATASGEGDTKVDETAKDGTQSRRGSSIASVKAEVDKVAPSDPTAVAEASEEPSHGEAVDVPAHDEKSEESPVGDSAVKLTDERAQAKAEEQDVGRSVDPEKNSSPDATDNGQVSVSERDADGENGSDKKVSEVVPHADSFRTAVGDEAETPRNIGREPTAIPTESSITVVSPQEQEGARPSSPDCSNEAPPDASNRDDEAGEGVEDTSTSIGQDSGSPGEDTEGGQSCTGEAVANDSPDQTAGVIPPSGKPPQPSSARSAAAKKNKRRKNRRRSSAASASSVTGKENES